MTGDDDLQLFQNLVLAFDTPAFLRRARRVEAAWDALLERCRRERDALLEMPRLRLARLAALVESWPALPSGLCEAGDAAYLASLHGQWRPRLAVPVPPARSPAQVARALAAVAGSFERFNGRWKQAVEGIDLGPVNRLRDGYNRYYVLEKECALRSPRTAQDGFTPLPAVTVGDLLDHFPLLRVPNVMPR